MNVPAGGLAWGMNPHSLSAYWKVLRSIAWPTTRNEFRATPAMNPLSGHFRSAWALPRQKTSPRMVNRMRLWVVSSDDMDHRITSACQARNASPRLCHLVQVKLAHRSRNGVNRAMKAHRGVLELSATSGQIRSGSRKQQAVSARVVALCP